MTDYCENIVKVFIPEDLAHLAPQIVTGLADPDAIPGREGVWMAFERLIPRPTLYDKEGLDDEIDAAVAARVGRRHRNLEWGDAPPEGPEAVTAALRAMSPAHARAMDIVEERFRRYSAPTAIEWQSTRWGSKWDAMPGDPPTVTPFDDVPGAHGLPYDGTVMVSWRFTTANSPPVGYLEALARLCQSCGFGLRAWFSDNEGTAYNPSTDEVETVWTAIDDVTLEIEETTASRRLELAGGIEIRPDEIAEARIERRDPIYTLTE